MYHGYRSCVARTEGRGTLVDLIVFSIVDCDVIMGVDWLASCHAIFNCHLMTVRFEILSDPSFELKGDSIMPSTKISLSGTLRN